METHVRFYCILLPVILILTGGKFIWDIPYDHYVSL